jgi:protein-S-isoprenylcysteine O-methyltransferase Ste14
MLLATAGVAGLTADALSIGVAAAVWAILPVQARLEEAFLLTRHPREYPAYLRQTGRFWPNVAGR